MTHFCDANVGLFAAISGFLFADTIRLRTSETWGDLVIRRTQRLLPIYLVWSVVYLGIRLFSTASIQSGDIARNINTPYFWGKFIFAGGGACHLWFLIDLLYVQILLTLTWRFLPRFFNNSLAIGAISILALVFSSMSSGDFFYYFMRMFSFVLLGILVYRMTSYRTNCFAPGHPMRMLLIGIIVMAMIVHVTANAYLPRFVRDYLLIFPLLYLAVTSPKIGVNKAVGFFSKTSMGVFLLHPLFAVGCAQLVTHFVSPPYSVGIIMLDWILVYLLALCATVLTFVLRLQKWVI